MTGDSSGRFLTRVASVVLLAGLLAVAASAGPAGSSTIAACIRDPQCHRLLVVAHRAKGLGAPENSREAVRRCAEAGVPVVNIHLRRSRDGQLFVIHDGTLDRTTTLQGRIQTMTAEALSQARLANGESLPRFEEIYTIGRGRTVLALNFKAEAVEVERVADWIGAHGSFDDVIFHADTGEEMEAAARAKKRHPAMMTMVRLLDTRVTVETTRAVFGGRLPEILHTSSVGAAEVSRLHALGVKVYVSAVRADGYIQPIRYFLVRSILRAAPDFVQTDAPLAIMRRVAG